MRKLKLEYFYQIARTGAHLWRPAFDEGRDNNYYNLKFLEKLGYKLYRYGLVNICEILCIPNRDLEIYLNIL